MKKYMAVTLLVSLFQLSTPAVADIYMYLDSDGILHFTNTPTSSHYKLYLKEKPKKIANTQAATSKYDHIISDAAYTAGISFALIKAMIQVESNFNPEAVSKKGAMGLMQIMPENLEAFNIEDPFDPRENIMGGSLYFRELLARYDGQLPLALAAYNAGPNIVDRYRGIPPIKETEAYVEKVMTYYYAFREK
ncbi:MAG: lytic transglycosylase domain-containing protein [Deltaproteobacteria bacterium]|nr:lytic transglycosylase domain-containing protein [Deltaproteobacteria bacterium]